MNELEKYNVILGNLPIDIRLEVLLADLLMHNVNFDDVVIHSKSVFKRNFHFDIERIQYGEHDVRGKKNLKIELNRNSLYDHLPEGLFHQPTDFKTYMNKEKAIEEIKVQNEREKAARKFFLPIEQEFYLLGALLENEEKSTLFQTNVGFLGKIFNQFWDLPNFLDQNQKNILGLLMPLIHEVVGDLEETAEIIKLITGETVELVPSPPHRTIESECPALGQIQLGADFIMGGELRELQQSITLRIHFDDPELFLNHICGETKRKVYDYLCELLIPYEIDYTIQYNLGRQYSDFNLKEETNYAGRLGYSTII